MRAILLLSAIIFGAYNFFPGVMEKVQKKLPDLENISLSSLKDNANSFVKEEKYKNSTQKISDFFQDTRVFDEDVQPEKVDGVWKVFLMDSNTGQIVNSNRIISRLELNSGFYSCKKCFCPYNKNVCFECIEQNMDLCKEKMSDNL
jgi:hypothetical protein